MSGRTEERKILKQEKIEISDEIAHLIDSLNQRKSLVDERVVKKMGDNMGLKTSDAKVYKLFSALTENFVDDLITSINHKRHRELIDIDEKLIEATKESKISRDQPQKETTPS